MSQQRARTALNDEMEHRFGLLSERLPLELAMRECAFVMAKFSGWRSPTRADHWLSLLIPSARHSSAHAPTWTRSRTHGESDSICSSTLQERWFPAP